MKIKYKLQLGIAELRSAAWAPTAILDEKKLN